MTQCINLLQLFIYFFFGQTDLLSHILDIANLQVYICLCVCVGGVNSILSTQLNYKLFSSRDIVFVGLLLSGFILCVFTIM